MTGESFTPDEQARLAPYVTNTDRSIFALTNLPEVIKGALFSRYSRSTLGLRHLLLREFIEDEAAEFSAIQGSTANTDQD
ncbi:MAG: thymidylate synthase, partial [SAR324 cluster bacterium]|nr:thymidylate synthase [SAR324 cluster bacterium]